MKTNRRFVAAVTLNMAILTLIGLPVFLMAGPAASAAQAPVGMGTANSFAVLAGETITNTGPTTITGDVGLHPGSSVTGFDACPAANCVTLSGAKHVADAVAKQAKVDLVNSYVDAAGRTPVTLVATELGGTTLKAGVYAAQSGTFGLTGTLKLDAEGNPNAVFIFQMASTLITAAASNVQLINGADACNVFWKVGSSATLATGSSFTGNIFALTSIALKTAATLEGRAFARNGAVTMDTNTITRGTCSSTAQSAPTPTPAPTARPGAGVTTSPKPAATKSPGSTTGSTTTPSIYALGHPGSSSVTGGEVARGKGPLPRGGANIGMFVLVALGLIAGGEVMRRWARASRA